MVPAVQGRIRGADRRRGAALIFVLIFGLMMMSIVITLLSLGESSVKGQADTHRQLQLHCVLRAGIADAVNEINVPRVEGAPTPGSLAEDPGADGIGCRIRVAPNTPNTGIPVTAPNGEILGYYRATLSTPATGRKRLTVVAAMPSFDNPQYAVSAHVEIDKGRPPFPANAISFSGNTDAGYPAGATQSLFEVAGNNVRVEAMEFSVPAVNATDSTTFTNITNPDNNSDSLVSDSKTLIGANPASPGSSTTGAGTMTNDAAGVLSGETIQKIADAIDATVTSHPAVTPDSDPETADKLVEAAVAQNGLGAITNTGSLGTISLSKGFYRLDSSIVVTGKITGSGTLIITKDLILKGEIVWDGNVIVQGNDALLKLDTATLTVNGVLAVQAKGSTATMDVKGTVNVNGGFTVLCDVGSSLTLQSGAKINVVGVMALLGEDIKFTAEGGGSFDVTGSLAFSSPENATIGISKVKLGSGNHNLTFTEATFNAGIDALGEFYDPKGEFLPITATKYWEENAHAQRVAQEAYIGGSTATTGKFGMLQ